MKIKALLRRNTTVFGVIKYFKKNVLMLNLSNRNLVLVAKVAMQPYKPAIFEDIRNIIITETEVFDNLASPSYNYISIGDFDIDIKPLKAYLRARVFNKDGKISHAKWRRTRWSI